MTIINLEGFPFRSFEAFTSAYKERAVVIGVNTEIGVHYLISSEVVPAKRAIGYLLLVAPHTVGVIFLIYSGVNSNWLLFALAIPLFIAAYILSHPGTVAVLKSFRLAVRAGFWLPLLASLVFYIEGYSKEFWFAASIFGIMSCNVLISSLVVRTVKNRAIHDEEFLSRLWNTNAISFTLADGSFFSHGSFLLQASPQVVDDPTSRSQENGPSTISFSKLLDGVQRGADGRATITLPPNAGPVEALLSMVLSMRAWLRPDQSALIKQWAVAISGMPITNNEWSPEQEDIFLRGFERFCWEGGAGASFPAVETWFREKYTQISGTRLDVPLPDEIRALFAAWFTEETQSESKTKNFISNNPDEAQFQKRGFATKPEMPQIYSEMLQRARYYRLNNLKVSDWEQMMVREFGADVVPLLKNLWDDTSGL